MPRRFACVEETVKPCALLTVFQEEVTSALTAVWGCSPPVPTPVFATGGALGATGNTSAPDHPAVPCWNRVPNGSFPWL